MDREYVLQTVTVIMITLETIVADIALKFRQRVRHFGKRIKHELWLFLVEKSYRISRYDWLLFLRDEDRNWDCYHFIIVVLILQQESYCIRCSC